MNETTQWLCLLNKYINKRTNNALPVHSQPALLQHVLCFLRLCF